MATQPNFRSAFNGFNRDDVVHYIEYLNTKHAAEIEQLRSEIQALQEQPAPAIEDESIVEQQAGRIRELFDQNSTLEKELADLQRELEEAVAAKEEVNAAHTAALSQQNNCKSYMEEELAAYRRAERTERIARERADQLYRQTSSALENATAKVDDAADQLGQLTSRVIEQLNHLQNAVSGSKQALREATATTYTIRPTDSLED